ncbi:cytokine receptor-like factor 2 [Xenopus laevis]|uniref:Cytokine receptor-like factor 2 n=1 Tax=Xenopus laevis TaxID=8355 RepID=A0A8J1M624_XENLA|nr:cytokine receptor-like factor 2 [Xenopus laevis]
MFFICIVTVIQFPFGQLAGLYPPENVTFEWENQILYIYTNYPKLKNTKQPLHHLCFELQMQIKSSTAINWEVRLMLSECGESTLFYCSINNPSFDPEKCYLIRVRLEVSDTCLYGQDRQSDWGQLIFSKNGTFLDSCPVERVSNRLIVLLATILPLLICVVALLPCTIKRIKKRLFPIVPDPKHKFTGLFEDHSGNFQQWVKKEKDELLATRIDALEEEEEEVEEEKEEEAELIVEKWETEDDIQLEENEACRENPYTDEEQAEIIISHAQTQIETIPDICIANLTFPMNDRMYIML